jgi:hypothetical protein
VRLDAIKYSESRGKEFAARKAQLEKAARIFQGKSQGDLTEAQKRFLGKNLFRFRWIDEWIRVQSVLEFEAKIRQGYSPEVMFMGHSVDGDGVYKFSFPDWESTLRGFQFSRSQAKRFPLRTPDFNVSESGVIFVDVPAPERYAQMYDSYRMGELFSTLKNLGSELWNPAEFPLAMTRCLGCEAIFELRNPKRKYCSEDCRQSAKHRRWRERDPERAREANARYYAKHYRNSFVD